MTAQKRAESDVQRAVALVEEAIRGLGIDPAASRTKREGAVAYALRRGSARILIAVYSPTEGAKEGTLRAVASVVRIPPPPNDAAMFRRLLELNATDLSGAAFAISAQEVVVVSERSVRDLDASEADALIRNVGQLADRYDDELAKSYGAVRASDA